MTSVAILINLLLIAFAASLVWKKLATSDSITYWLAVAARLLGGIAVGVVYTYFYEGVGDTFVFFNDAIEVYQGDITMITSEPRSLFFVYVVGFINLITANNYWITSLWLSLFSFICSYRLVIKLDQFFPSLRMASRIAILFFPSFVFWSSGILKESLSVGAVQILSIYFLSTMRDEKLNTRAIIEIVLALILLLNLKYYWAAVLLPAMITALIVKKLDPKKIVAVWYVIIFLVLCLAVSFTHPNFYLSRFLSVIVENNNMYTDGNLIHYNGLSPNWISILINSPLALFSGMFRPLVNVSSVLAGLASLENLVLLGLFIWKIKYIRMPAPENRLIFFAVLTYIVVLCIFLALSTPNLGTLSRYRVGFLSFFVLLILADHPILNFINGKPSHHIRS